MYILSCICLSFVGLCCVAGVLSRLYRDNFLQRIGMSILAIGCAARVGSIWTAQTVAVDWFTLHGGLALFAAGTVLNVRAAQRKRLRRHTDSSQIL